jgi:hypothetical protein
MVHRDICKEKDASVRPPNNREHALRTTVHALSTRHTLFPTFQLHNTSLVGAQSFFRYRANYSLHKESEERNFHVVARSWRRTSSPHNNPPVVASREECSCKTLPKIWSHKRSRPKFKFCAGRPIRRRTLLLVLCCKCLGPSAQHLSPLVSDSREKEYSRDTHHCNCLNSSGGP